MVTLEAQLKEKEASYSTLNDKYKRLLSEQADNIKMVNAKQEEIQRLTISIMALQEEITKVSEYPLTQRPIVTVF